MRFEIRQGDEYIASHSGLALVGELIDKTQLKERLNKVHLDERPRPEISHGDIVMSMIGLLSLGKADFDDIVPFIAENSDGESFFEISLKLSRMPSSETLRQRLDQAHGVFDEIICEENVRMLKVVGAPLTPLQTKNGTRMLLHVDVSPFDNSGSKKEGVSPTYKKFDGYAPQLAYLGKEGYLIHSELREGKQHCQNGTPEFLDQALSAAQKNTDIKILAMMDSGNDSVDNMKVCRKRKADWLIKRNIRKEPLDDWLDTAWAFGKASEPREGQMRLVGETHRVVDGLPGLQRIVFEVFENTIDSKGQPLLIADVDANTWWTSLKDDPEDIVKYYHTQGTAEQFHSELKTDLGLERLPSGKFETNATVLLLGMFAYNALRIIGQMSLQKRDTPLSKKRQKVFRRRLRSVIQDMMYLGCRIVRHARRVILSFGRNCSWYPPWQRVYSVLLE